MAIDQGMTWVTLTGGPLDGQQRQVPLADDNPYGNPPEFLRFHHPDDLMRSPAMHLAPPTSSVVRILTYRRVDRREGPVTRWHEWHHVADKAPEAR